MIRRILELFVFLSLLCFVTGCTQPKQVYKTRLEHLYENNFKDFIAPEALQIKDRGKRESRSFPFATYDEVWDSIIILLIQEGIILRSSKDSGVIVTAPKQPVVFFTLQSYFINPAMVIYVEKGEEVTVYLAWMEKLYLKGSRFPPDAKEIMAKPFFDKLSTQVYAGEKWKWLVVGSE